ncbi:MAG: MucR family transcriptional regulator [Desulfocapsa sp.]|nr:MucR family transcriptional regulator [Desulfocapsa sp.]
MTKTLVEMAAEIVQAQGSSQNMSIEELQESLKETFSTLQNLQAMESGEPVVDAEEQRPAITPEKSILKNKIICLECGEEFKTLSFKHLNSHDLTRRDYRIKYGFSLRQPLCAKALTEKRKKAGKERGIPDALKKSIASRKKTTATAKKKPAAQKAIKK